ncbi:MAG: ABC transporter ATP-binding protein [Burkholderiales bacterium]|nr:ABC transporter ATP-binding protein [Anaerolineae bacterium]
MDLESNLQQMTATAAPNPLLEVEDLKVSFRTKRGLLPVIDSVNVTLNANQAMGIVGESGSGKTMLCRALIGTLSRHSAVITSGKLLFDGNDLANAPDHTWRQVRGRHIGYVPQSSLAGLNPVLTVGTQLIESIRVVKSIGQREAEREALELLERVHIARAPQVLKARSPELSGGMRQRVMIAAAIAQKPELLVADEPTTALDVTVQREILNLLKSLRQDLGMALILISHDLAVIEEMCESMVVMYAGASIESGTVEALVNTSRHPYTRSLRASRIDRAVPGQDIEAISGDPLTVGNWPAGCRFWPRCPLGDDACQHGQQPALAPVARQLSACIYADRIEN